MPFLEIDNLRKRFAGTEVLKGIDLDLEQGGFLVLVGPSGCGKSTLLNSIAGLEPVTAGEIRLNGRVINDLHPSKRDIAMVFQSYALYPNMNVAQNMGFGLEMRRIPRPERERAVADVAKMLQIEHLLTRKPSQLSGGQRQRVAMGRALVRQPQVFLFDEPLSNLDAKLRVDMRTEIKRLHQSVGATIVYVTHDQIEAMTLATKIAVLKDGAIQQVGTPAEVYNRPANLFVADFMGSPAMNLMKVTVTASAAGPALSLERPEDDPHIVPLSPELGRAAGGPGRTLILGIRPEAIADRDAADRNGRSVAFLDCRIEVVEPAGSDTYIVTRLGGVEVIARVRAEVEMRPGDVVPLAFNLDKAVLFDPETEVRL